MRLLAAAVGIVALANQDPKPEDFLPSKTGTAWTYVSEGREMRVTVAGSEKIGEIECVVYEAAVAGQLQRDFFTIGQDGLISRRTVVGERVVDPDPPICRLKFPLKKGESWEWKGRQGSRESKATFTNEGEEEIVVPAGKFRAWKVFSGMDSDAGGSTSTYWYVAGIGMIRQDTCVSIQGKILKVSAELKAFEPGK